MFRFSSTSISVPVPGNSTCIALTLTVGRSPQPNIEPAKMPSARCCVARLRHAISRTGEPKRTSRRPSRQKRHAGYSNHLYAPPFFLPINKRRRNPRTSLKDSWLRKHRRFHPSPPQSSNGRDVKLAAMTRERQCKQRSRSLTRSSGNADNRGFSGPLYIYSLPLGVYVNTFAASMCTASGSSDGGATRAPPHNGARNGVCSRDC